MAFSCPNLRRCSHSTLYFNRKDSEHEDKIKERENAEIDAKKGGIRAEDIAKGVFVPASSLPQREPQKGTQIA